MRYPDVSFDVGDFEALDAATDSLGGLLSWYSLIHQIPEEIQTPLAEFARVIRPGGGGCWWASSKEPPPRLSAMP